MTRIKKILVPLDFSDHSLRALTFAANIAKKAPASITLLNVIPSPQIFYGYPDYAGTSAVITGEQSKYMDNLHKHSKTRLNILKQTALLRNLVVESKITSDTSIYKQILQQAEEIKASIIVMGTEGTTSFSKTFMGTNTERVIRLTDIPVLTIDKKSSINRFKKIVFASDFSKDSFKVYPVINTIENLFGSKVHLLRVNTKDDFKSTDQIYLDINQFMKRFKGNFIPTWRAAQQVFEGITKYSKSVNADLIAIGVKRKKGLSRLLGTRTVESIIRHSNIPVLAVDIPR